MLLIIKKQLRHSDFLTIGRHFWKYFWFLISDNSLNFRECFVRRKSVSLSKDLSREVCDQIYTWIPVAERNLRAVQWPTPQSEITMCEPEKISFRPLMGTEVYMDSYMYELIGNSLLPGAPNPYWVQAQKRLSLDIYCGRKKAHVLRYFLFKQTASAWS